MWHTTPVSDNDTDFLYQVYAGTRGDEVAAWGWAPAQQEAFLRMQFQLQRRSYAMQFPEAVHRLIWLEDQPVGQVLVSTRDRQLLLVDISFLPAYRNRGLGAAVIRDLQAQAAQQGRSVLLHVMFGNQAQRLYERLGFAVTGETGTHFVMEWSPLAQ